MKKLHVFRWLLMAALAASLPISAQAAGGRGMGGGPHFSSGRGFGFHDGRFSNRFVARGRFFRGNRFFVRNRFFTRGRFVPGFGFVGFGLPVPFPYPYPFYGPGPYWGPGPYGGW
jgi:hypothetical protein